MAVVRPPLSAVRSDGPTLPNRLGLRERLVAGVVFLVWCALAARLVQLQLHSGEALTDLAERQQTVDETVAARPGEIVDRAGRVFATSVTSRSLYLIPSRLKQPHQVCEQLADALGLDANKLASQVGAKPDSQFLWVKRRLSPAELERVRSLKLPPATWGFRDEFRRHYPMGRLAAHVVGMRNVDNVGQGGVEQEYDKTLRGKDGRRELVRDARGRIIEIRSESVVPPVHGQTVQLTLDARIQLHVEKVLDEVVTKWKPASACAVVLDPQTGDVLALGSRPTFDPNHPELATPAAWKNNALCSIYEPGSTFKPFIVAWALQTGVIERDQTFHCENGEYRMGRRRLHDHHPYGHLSVVDILVKSSNIGMAKIGEKLGNPRLYEATLAFGFGAPTGIDLPGELPGILRPLKEWTSYSTGSIPMGQELSSTPIQIIAAYGALSNGGRLIAPHVLLEASPAPPEPEPSNVQIEHPLTGHVPLWIPPAPPPEESPADGVIVSPTNIDGGTADWVRTTALTAVVERGTGRKGQVPGYRVFGKTGTAQKLNPRGGYSDSRHISSFVCGAPAENPRVLVIVSVDDPRAASKRETFGGSVAAPPAGQILEKSLQLLGVSPDPKAPAITAVPEEEALVD